MAAGAILLPSAVYSTSPGTQVLSQASATSMSTPGTGAPAAGSIAAGTPDVARVKAMVAQLNVTAAVGQTSLDVWFQSSVDGGTNWNDFAHFTQVTGATGLVQLQWVRDVTPTTPVGANKDAALAVGVNQGPVGSDWRLKWVIVGTSFTFSVRARFFLDKH